jgi:hypothetical protein
MDESVQVATLREARTARVSPAGYLRVAPWCNRTGTNTFQLVARQRGPAHGLRHAACNLITQETEPIRSEEETMNRSKHRLASLMALVAIGLALGVSADAASPVSRDRFYRSSKLNAFQPNRVAILPVVAVAENLEAERLVERTWVDLYGRAGIEWMPADRVRARLAQLPGEREDLAAEVDGQVWQRGEVDSAMAARLTQRLGVDALLSVRIDRWEIADGGRGMVELSVVLTNADGTRLWSISGLAGCGTPFGSPGLNFNADMSWFRDPRLESQCQDEAKLGGALCNLLIRWEAALPAAPVYAQGGASGLFVRTHID